MKLNTLNILGPSLQYEMGRLFGELIFHHPIL